MQLAQYEAAAGRLLIGVEAPGEPSAADAMAAQAMGTKLGASRVHTVSDDMVGAEAVGDAIAAIRSAGLTIPADADADIVASPSEAAPPAVAPLPRAEVSTSVVPAMAQAVLVFGSECAVISAKMTLRSGGTRIDMEVLLAEAKREVSEEAAEAVALMEAGGLLPMKQALPLIRSVMSHEPAPYIFSGFPRMAAHVKTLEEDVGKLALAVASGDVSAAADTSLRNFFSKNETHVCDAADVDVVLDTMARAGLQFTRSAAAPVAEEAAEEVVEVSEQASVATIERHVQIQQPVDDAPKPASRPSTSAVTKGQSVLVVGSLFAATSAALAQRSGGTLIDMEVLLAAANELAASESNEEAAAFLQLIQSGGIMAPKHYMPMIELVLARRPAPYIFSGFPRMPPHVKTLEELVGKLALAVTAGDVLAAADTGLRNFFSTHGVSVVGTSSEADEEVGLALDAMALAGVRFKRVAQPGRPITRPSSSKGGKGSRGAAPPSEKEPPTAALPIDEFASMGNAMRNERPTSAAGGRGLEGVSEWRTVAPPEAGPVRRQRAGNDPGGGGREFYAQKAGRAQKTAPDVAVHKRQMEMQEKLGLIPMAPAPRMRNAPATAADGLPTAWGSRDEMPGRRPSPKRPGGGRRLRPDSAPVSSPRSGVRSSRSNGLGFFPGSEEGEGTFSSPYLSEGLWPLNNQTQHRFAAQYACDARLQQVHLIYGQYIGQPRPAPSFFNANRRFAGVGPILVGDYFPMPASPEVVPDSRIKRSRPGSAKHRRAAPPYPPPPPLPPPPVPPPPTRPGRAAGTP